jgi:hypothetical protein
MIIYSWNVKGLNNPLKQHEVVGLMKKFRMDICGLLETKLTLSRVARLHRLRLRDWKYISNANAASIAHIVVFWNPSTVSVDLISSTAQALHLSVHSLISQYNFHVTFVYGYNFIYARRSLWADLRCWNSSCP